jgi:ketosteroid isomerase-like protein
MSSEQDFEKFLNQREKAASAYINGEAGPLGDLSTSTNPASFMGPGGGEIHGAREVTERYASDARFFATGSTGHFEIIHAEASGDLGYWVGFQRATTYFKGKADPVPFNLRITEIFRKENGQWKLIHRHADPLAEAQERK